MNSSRDAAKIKVLLPALHAVRSPRASILYSVALDKPVRALAARIVIVMGGGAKLPERLEVIKKSCQNQSKAGLPCLPPICSHCFA
jgi:hypothetical protein